MNKEILLVVEAVSNEKGVESEVIFHALEAALEMATKKRAEDRIDVKVTINRKTGDYSTVRRWLIVDDETAAEEDDENEDAEGFNTAAHISLSEARLKNPAATLGGYIEEPMDSVEFGRIAAQKAKQVIVQK